MRRSGIHSAIKFIRTISLFLILTVLTQIGGLVFLTFKAFCSVLVFWGVPEIKKRSYRVVFFIGLYSLTIMLIVPPLAEWGGRVPLPVNSVSLKAWSPTSLLCNRHYVRPELKRAIVELSDSFYEEHGVGMTYLDANFPFWDGFPLLPHRSHNDGRKLDISFVYRNANGALTTWLFSFFGYGVSTLPQKGEVNMPAICAEKGYWQYSLLHYLAPGSGLPMDEKASRALMLKIIQQPQVRKVFMEPHLKQRLQLDAFSKVRFHGCHAVRHDDHIHLEI